MTKRLQARKILWKLVKRNFAALFWLFNDQCFFFLLFMTLSLFPLPYYGLFAAHHGHKFTVCIALLFFAESCYWGCGDQRKKKRAGDTVDQSRINDCSEALSFLVPSCTILLYPDLSPLMYCATWTCRMEEGSRRMKERLRILLLYCCAAFLLSGLWTP